MKLHNGMILPLRRDIVAVCNKTNEINKFSVVIELVGDLQYYMIYICGIVVGGLRLNMK
jgi:hypothetical protein